MSRSTLPKLTLCTEKRGSRFMLDDADRPASRSSPMQPAITVASAVSSDSDSLPAVSAATPAVVAHVAAATAGSVAGVSSPVVVLDLDWPSVAPAAGDPALVVVAVSGVLSPAARSASLVLAGIAGPLQGFLYLRVWVVDAEGPWRGLERRVVGDLHSPDAVQAHSRLGGPQRDWPEDDRALLPPWRIQLRGLLARPA